MFPDVVLPVFFVQENSEDDKKRGRSTDSEVGQVGPKSLAPHLQLNTRISQDNSGKVNLFGVSHVAQSKHAARRLLGDVTFEHR